MSVGLPVTRAEIDNRAGTIMRSVFAVMRDVAQFKAWLDTVPDQDLETTYNYQPGEVAVLRSAYGDADHLAQVWAGGEPKADAYLYQQFAKQLTGINIF